MSAEVPSFERQSTPSCVGGWRAWPIDVCSNKDVGNRERETPTPLCFSGPLHGEEMMKRTERSEEKRNKFNIPKAVCYNIKLPRGREALHTFLQMEQGDCEVQRAYRGAGGQNLLLSV